MKNLYTQLALTYRLSIKTMAELLNQNPINIYNDFVFDSKLGTAMKYLFDVETANETEETRLNKKRKAKAFLFAILHAKKNQNQDLKTKLLTSLFETDKAFQNVKDKLTQYQDVSTEDILAIVNYRLKYGISRSKIAEELSINVKFLSYQEIKIEDENIQKSLSVLNKYSQFMSLSKPRHKL